MTAPTDAPVEERHRRAAAEGMVKLMPELAIDADEARWIENGGERAPHSFRLAAQVAANAERDGCAARDAEAAEAAELRAYRGTRTKGDAVSERDKPCKSCRGTNGSHTPRCFARPNKSASAPAATFLCVGCGAEMYLRAVAAVHAAVRALHEARKS